MQTIIILGAAGRIGDAAARAFVEAGWRVKGAVRGVHGRDLPADVEWVKVDATDRRALTEACAGADVVLNALNPLYTEWEEKVLPMALNVIHAVEAVGATQLLPGNVYNFGHAIGMGTREDAPRVASTPKARIRIEMERLFERAAAERGARTVVLRAGDFYGGTKPGGWLDAMILARLRKDIFAWPGPMDLPHAFAYLPDLARAFVALAERRASLPAFDTVHFEGHTLTGEAFKAATEAAIGRPLRRRGVPWTLLRAGGLFVPMLRELSAMSYLWRTAHSLDGARMRDLLGPVQTTEPVAAIGRAVADLGLDRGVAKLAA